MEFFITLPFLRTRPYLFHLFRLSCLCLTSESPELPKITLGSTNNSKLECILSEVFFPVQSYLTDVPSGAAVCVEAASLANFSEVEAQFGDNGFPDTYDPWCSVDFFGRSEILQKFRTVFGNVSGGAGKESPKKGSKTSSVISATKSELSDKEAGPSQVLIASGVGAVVSDPQEGSTVD